MADSKHCFRTAPHALHGWREPSPNGSGGIWYHVCPGEQEQVAVPVSLIERIDRLIAPDTHVTADLRDAVHALLPKPPAPRYRIVDLDAIEHAESLGAINDLLESAPDVLMLLDGVIDDWGCEWSMTNFRSGARDALKAAIRAAFEQAVHR